jgi:5-methylcytosine-specific restriction endonuclease McrA
MVWQRDSNRIVPGDWATRKARVLQRDARVCHVCHHAGADQVDHIINVAHGGTHELSNLAPIHGDRCPTCAEACHKAKTAREAADGRRQQRAKAKHPVLVHPGLRRPHGDYPTRR